MFLEIRGAGSGVPFCGFGILAADVGSVEDGAENEEHDADYGIGFACVWTAGPVVFVVEAGMEYGRGVDEGEARSLWKRSVGVGESGVL